jgi:hypothetical protein
VTLIKFLIIAALFWGAFKALHLATFMANNAYENHRWSNIYGLSNNLTKRLYSYCGGLMIVAVLLIGAAGFLIGTSH